jgi:membrane protein YdbS with pleckstrin-like domain
MSKSRHLHWPSEPPRPKHGYKDTVLVYLFLGVIVVLFAWLSGGNVVKGVVVAAILFVVGSVYSLVRWHDLVRHLRGREGERP